MNPNRKPGEPTPIPALANTQAREKGGKIGWKLFLLIPYLALCFPALYSRATPSLFGFPFFYWYQFLWVFLTSALLGLIYLKLKDPQDD